MNHLSEEELMLLYYREIAAPEHLGECAGCRAAAEAMARSLDAIGEWQPAPPPAELERTVWAALAPQLADPPRRRPRWPVWAAAFAALLVMAFVLGRVTSRPAVQPAPMAGLSPQARQRILRISLADHLDRAGMLMTEISNAAELEPGERERAQDLVDEGRLMRPVLLAGGDAGTAALVDEVERFMLEVANSDERAAELRKRIAAGSLLFKVRIIETNLRSQGKKS